MIELVILPRDAALPGDMHVRRILPFHARRMVGPFTFLDEMGPVDLKTDGSTDVPPHPHIGLSTVTYLFEGEMTHRDSLGSVQKILPGDVNWMTAGRGIVHSERFPSEELAEGGKPPTRMHGLQAWVALPLEAEESAPTFFHHAKETLPRFKVDGVDLHLIAGSAYGKSSPVKTHSKLFYLSAAIPEEATLRFDPEGQEAAFYLVSGKVAIESQVFMAPTLIVFKTGVEIEITAERATFGMLLGGSALEGPRHIHWNFVSSSLERIEEVKRLWTDQSREDRFPVIPGESDFVPLPT